MTLKFDMPGDWDGTPFLLDANAGFGLEDPTIPTSYIFTEKFVVAKESYLPLDIGTASEERTDTFLYEEGDFVDVGGGLFVFNRRYAAIPEPNTVITEDLQISTVPMTLISDTQVGGDGLAFLGATRDQVSTGDIRPEQASQTSLDTVIKSQDLDTLLTAPLEIGTYTYAVPTILIDHYGTNISSAAGVSEPAPIVYDGSGVIPVTAIYSFSVSNVLRVDAISGYLGEIKRYRALALDGTATLKIPLAGANRIRTRAILKSAGDYYIEDSS